MTYQELKQRVHQQGEPMQCEPHELCCIEG